MSDMESAAHKTLWGFLRLMAPPPPQEVTREATSEERLATISGWRHVRGRWFWRQNGNVLMRAGQRFVRAYHRIAKQGKWD